MFSSTRLVFQWKNGGGPRLLKWSILFFRMRGSCIILTKMKAMSLSASPSLQFFWNIQRKADHPRAMQEFRMSHQMSVMRWHIIRCHLKKQNMCKVCKNNFRCRYVTCRANLHDICFEIFVLKLNNVLKHNNVWLRNARLENVWISSV